MMGYLEDAAINGEWYELGAFTFTAEAIKGFARQFDPQPFHLDEEAGRRSIFGGLSASGWHVTAIYMKLMVGAMERAVAARRARGEQIVVSGPSPGFRELKWIKPVLAGDTLTYRMQHVAARPLASRPGWGLLNSLIVADNQRGERVFSFIGSVFLPTRPADAAS